jgi:hypothetical protein
MPSCHQGHQTNGATFQLKRAGKAALFAACRYYGNLYDKASLFQKYILLFRGYVALQAALRGVRFVAHSCGAMGQGNLSAPIPSYGGQAKPIDAERSSTAWSKERI